MNCAFREQLSFGDVCCFCLVMTVNISADICFTSLHTCLFLFTTKLFYYLFMRWNLLLSLQVVDFYDYYKGQMEAWDGPALLLFR